MRSILITGGSGFIGSHFHNVLPHDHLINLDLQLPFFNHTSEYVSGDIRKPEDIERALTAGRVTRIISLAAKHHDFGIGHDEYFDTNEQGTQVLCDAAAKHGIKEIVFYSSVAVYGSNIETSTEKQVPTPDSPYGSSKLAGEKVLERWAMADPSRKVLIIRPALVFGANNKANMFNLIRQIDSGFYFHVGKADNIKSIAYVENLVQLTLRLADSMKAGVAIYNYADEPQLTSKVIGETIATALKKKIRITLPRELAVLCGIPFDILIKLTGKNLPISSARIKKLSTQTAHSASKAFATGFMPKFTTTEGIQKMVQWYEANKK